MSYYIHHIPGRLRVKSPVVKNNRFAASKVESLLVTQEGVRKVDINVTTGSVLIEYDGSRMKRNDIVHLLQEEGYFDKSKAMTNDEYFHNVSVKFLELLTVFI